MTFMFHIWHNRIISFYHKICWSLTFNNHFICKYEWCRFYRYKELKISSFVVKVISKTKKTAFSKTRGSSFQRTEVHSNKPPTTIWDPWWHPRIHVFVRTNRASPFERTGPGGPENPVFMQFSPFFPVFARFRNEKSWNFSRSFLDTLNHHMIDL